MTTPRKRAWLAGMLAAAVAPSWCATAAASPDEPNTPNTPRPQPELTTPWTNKVDPAKPLPEYPRPQLVRAQWQNLNGPWQFEAATEGQAPPFGKQLSESVVVPFPIESALSGLKRHEDRMFYRRTFTVPRNWQIDASRGKRLQLHFGAVDYQTKVWVNGKLVKTHTGGYTGFSADVTSALKKSGPQEVVVGVTDLTDRQTQPTGKQDLRAMTKPGGIFYTPASGIWQTVWMEPTAPAHVHDVVPTTKPDLRTVSVRVNASGTGRERVHLRVLDGKRPVATTNGSTRSPLLVRVKKPKLWTPDKPFLYNLEVTLRDQRGKPVDRATSYFGMRTIGMKVGSDDKQHIVLNGKPMFLNSTLDQGYWPDGIYTAPTDEALAFDLKAHKELGFNTVRKHIKTEPSRWYYWADRMGLMVWQDMPSLNDGIPAPAAQAEFERQLKVTVRSLRGWTSIIGWVPFNEGWGEWSKEKTGRIAEAVKAIDPSRLMNAHSGVNCCQSKGDSGKGDIIDWHKYVGPASPNPTRTRAAIDGEHGGFGLLTPGHMWPGDPNAYQMAADKRELTDLYVANQRKLLAMSKQCGLSGGIYTQITDVETEVNGLYTYDRQRLKMFTDPVRQINEQLNASGNLGGTSPSYPPGTPGPAGTHAYEMEDGAGSVVKDDVGSANLTARNVTRTEGKTGQGLGFDGAGAAESATPIVDTAGNFSVAAWVKVSNTGGGGFQTAVSQDGDAASAFFLQYDAGANKFAFSTLGDRAYSNGNVVADRWYRLVGVRDAAAGTYTLYVDSEKQSEIAQCLGDASTGAFAVGRAKFGGKPVDFWRGTVDGVRVFDRALSPGEVKALS